MASVGVKRRERIGFLVYPHRHDCCFFSLEQHKCEGRALDVTASRHGDSSKGLHPAQVGVGATIRKKATIRPKNTRDPSAAATPFVCILTVKTLKVDSDGYLKVDSSIPTLLI